MEAWVMMVVTERTKRTCRDMEKGTSRLCLLDETTLKEKTKQSSSSSPLFAGPSLQGMVLKKQTERFLG